MSIRARLLTSFLGLMLLGLLLLGSVIFDSVKQTRLRDDMVHLGGQTRNLAQVLSAVVAKGHDDVVALLTVLDFVESEDLLELILTPDGEMHAAGEGRIRLDKDGRESLFNKIRNSEVEGSLSENAMIFIWHKAEIPQSRHTLVSILQEDDKSLPEFLKDFGLPLLVASLIIFWITIWVSLIIGALFKKLNKQKGKLEEQAHELEEARDRALQANNAKSSFLANISHEIRTPLTAVIGFSESVLGSDQSKEERLEALHTIHTSSKHVLNIINEILDLSKIEAEKLVIEKVVVSPLQVLQEVAQLMRMQATEKSLLFDINYKMPVPTTIITDPTRLKQILLNLFSNAIKFTAKGHVNINISCEPENRLMVFEVVDTGIGLTSEQSEKIFDAFTQADASTARKFGGTGLGLTLSRELSHMLDGSLTVTSEPDVGSCFRIEIGTGPLDGIRMIERIEDIPKESGMAPVPIPQMSLSGRVLLAEDSEPNQRLLGMYIRKMGAEATVVENGEEAIREATSSHYDLVLMDMQMPVMNGIDATKKLRHLNYTQPIVALTANTSKDDMDRCFDAGCDDFLTKPINRKRFTEVLTGYLHPAESKQDMMPVVSQLLEESPDLADIIEKFISGLPGMIEAIRQAANDSDWDNLKVQIHQLKGVGGGYGYPELSKLAAKTEFQVLNRNKGELDELLTVIEEYCGRICASRVPVPKTHLVPV